VVERVCRNDAPAALPAAIVVEELARAFRGKWRCGFSA
jgi:hypothetical protein